MITFKQFLLESASIYELLQVKFPNEEFELKGNGFEIRYLISKDKIRIADKIMGFLEQHGYKRRVKSIEGKHQISRNDLWVSPRYKEGVLFWRTQTYFIDDY